jgi:hypothetical protein
MFLEPEMPAKRASRKKTAAPAIKEEMHTRSKKR